MANGSAHLPCYLNAQWPFWLQFAMAFLAPTRNGPSGSNAMAFLAPTQWPFWPESFVAVWRCGYVALWLCSYVCNCVEMLLCGNKIICVPTTCLRIRPTKTSYIFSTALTNFSKTIARSAHNCLPLLRSK